MTNNELKKLALVGEGVKIEFKKKANHPDRIVNEIVAFANTKGGTLLIGVDDDGKISGTSHPEDDLVFIKQYLEDHIKPSPELLSGIIPVSSKKGVVWIKVLNQNKRLYASFLNPEDETGTVYVRLADESVKASPELRRILRNSARQGGRIIRFSEVESTLLKSLETDGKSTLPELVQKTGIKKKIVSNCLVNLVLANVLQIIPNQPRDFYIYKDEP